MPTYWWQKNSGSFVEFKYTTRRNRWISNNKTFLEIKLYWNLAHYNLIIFHVSSISWIPTRHKKWIQWGTWISKYSYIHQIIWIHQNQLDKKLMISEIIDPIDRWKSKDFFLLISAVIAPRSGIKYKHIFYFRRHKGPLLIVIKV